MKKSNPYEGLMKEGYEAFHNGKPRSANPYFGLTKRECWDKGWIKAKLAKEQGKKSL